MLLLDAPAVGAIAMVVVDISVFARIRVVWGTFGHHSLLFVGDRGTLILDIVANEIISAQKV